MQFLHFTQDKSNYLLPTVVIGFIGLIIVYLAPLIIVLLISLFPDVHDVREFKKDYLHIKYYLLATYVISGKHFRNQEYLKIVFFFFLLVFLSNQIGICNECFVHFINRSVYLIEWIFSFAWNILLDRWVFRLQTCQRSWQGSLQSTKIWSLIDGWRVFNLKFEFHLKFKFKFSIPFVPGIVLMPIFVCSNKDLIPDPGFGHCFIRIIILKPSTKCEYFPTTFFFRTHQNTSKTLL